MERTLKAMASHSVWHSNVVFDFGSFAWWSCFFSSTVDSTERERVSFVFQNWIELKRARGMASSALSPCGLCCCQNKTSLWYWWDPSYFLFLLDWTSILPFSVFYHLFFILHSMLSHPYQFFFTQNTIYISKFSNNCVSKNMKQLSWKIGSEFLRFVWNWEDLVLFYCYLSHKINDICKSHVFKNISCHHNTRIIIYI